MKVSETTITEEKKALTIEMPIIEHAYKDVFVNALSFLLYQFPSEFSEVNHQMFFPKTQGFSGDKEWYDGNIFQRSLIADTLIDCNAIMNGQLSPLIEHELAFLTDVRRKDGVGGWGYFTDLNELAPDADDLGQMIQLYARLKDEDSFKRYCEQPLQVLLHENQHTDGGFETWIIPKENRSAKEELQLHWAKEAWGIGADTEVVANLLHGLILHDSDRYKETIEKGIDFLWKRKEKNGSWLSTWYFGAYYGTYVALRTCLFLKPDVKLLTTTETFLTTTQLQSGGWGMASTANPLQTGFAVLSLCLINEYKGITDCDALTKGVQYLKRTQKPSGNWQSCPFIKMEMGRPTGIIHNTLEYGSKTITTVFAIKAIQRVVELKGSIS